jgi:hypothetical protein
MAPCNELGTSVQFYGDDFHQFVGQSRGVGALVLLVIMENPGVCGWAKASHRRACRSILGG